MEHADSSPRLRFPSGERMRASWEFQQVREQGRTLVGRSLLMNVLLPGMSADVPVSGRRFGVVIGRKLGNAVARNRVKRLLREAYRVSRPVLVSDARIVLVGRRSALWMKMPEVRADFLRLARQAGLVRSDAPPSASSCC